MINKKYFIRFNKNAGRLEQQVTMTGLKPVGIGWKEVEVDECCEFLPTPKTVLVSYESVEGASMLVVSPSGDVASDDNSVALLPDETAHVLVDTDYHFTTGQDGVDITTLEVQFKLDGVLKDTVDALVVTGGDFTVPDVEFDEMHFVGA